VSQFGDKPVAMRPAWINLSALPSLVGQSSGDWPMYNHDPAGTRYSALTHHLYHLESLVAFALP
jgi:hypothetical protein